MATQADIDAVIARTNAIWSIPARRNEHYGNILKTVQVNAIRGMTAALEFSWPVVAIAGANGSGKTTLLQLCSAAYVGEQGRAYRIGDWVRGAIANETPAFDATSSVAFSFWNDHPAVTIPYQRDRTRWGYPRHNNPTRRVEFVGITSFLPRVERKDRVHMFRSRLEIQESAAFDAPLMASICSVLEIPYERGELHTVSAAAGRYWQAWVPQIKKGEATYAEPHMGAGEQKVIGLIRSLEALPSSSLILLEEPEIMLHSDAQRGLAWYLMNLSLRRGHQIIVATHSTELFQALPIEARTVLVRKRTGIEVVPRAPYITAARQLARVATTNKDLVLVEDEVAQTFLIELMRKYDRTLLLNCSIVPVGNTVQVYQLVRKFRAERVRAIGVRDADTGDAPGAGIFSLPGTVAPEELLLHVANVALAEQIINGITDCYNRAVVAGVGLRGST
ncbi:MAG: ATP-binding cassette domain-containing protein, partial [Comamonadaceae bacterium]